MKKIAIVTLQDSNNYGNRLQNYAVQEVLKDMGNKPYSLVINDNNKKMEIKKWLLKNLLNKIPNRYNAFAQRYKCFVNFNELYMNLKYINFEELKSINCDNVVIGSDQVWNPHIVTDEMSEFYFARFIDNNKRIPFSPSFGFSEIPPEQEVKYKEWISEIPRISVREEAGCKIIKDLIERDSEVLIDPTLMLDKDKWMYISKKPKINLNENYILKYFLGTPSKKHTDFINEIARENSLTEYELLDKNIPELYGTGPSEFIELINKSSLICTDSFHGCVFSIIFNKPFIVFDRDGNGAGMNSRIINLLSKFKLERKKFECIDKNKIFENEYSESYKILEVERNKVLKFLRESMKDEG